jgi:hypothetical protein
MFPTLWGKTHPMLRPLLLPAMCIALFTACSGPADRPARSGAPAVQRVAPEQIQNRPASAGTAVANSADGSVRLNPPHGEPGHVCSIPVGQPLDGSGDASATIATSPESFGQPATQPTITLDDNASGQSGMINPPHGEPGHVCSVPVGQPIP